MRMRYNNEALILYATENKVRLLGDYSGNINRETPVVSECLTAGCENSAKKVFRQLKLTGSYCDVCTKIRTQIKREEKSMDRYRVKSPLQDPGVKEKIKATNREKYSVENPMQNAGIREKCRATNIKNLGVEYPSQDPGVREKGRATNMKNLGVEYASQDASVREKIKATNMKNLGVEYASQDPCVREIIKATNMVRFGVENPMQNAEVSERSSHNAYKAYDYTYPSGRIDRIQGYEKFGIDDLLKQGINEDDIVTKRTEVPICEFYDKEGKKHRYFVDILIQSQNKCIEVKSTWTFENKKVEVFMKQEALQDLGFSCEIWIYDKKGNRLEYNN